MPWPHTAPNFVVGCDGPLSVGENHRTRSVGVVQQAHAAVPGAETIRPSTNVACCTRAVRVILRVVIAPVPPLGLGHQSGWLGLSATWTVGSTSPVRVNVTGCLVVHICGEDSMNSPESVAVGAGLQHKDCPNIGIDASARARSHGDRTQRPSMSSNTSADDVEFCRFTNDAVATHLSARHADRIDQVPSYGSLIKLPS